MIGTFKANNPLNTFLLFIYGLVLKFLFLSNTHIPAEKKTDGILFKELIILLRRIDGQLPFIYSLITYLLLFTQAVTFNKLITNQRLMQRSTHLVAMSYLLITSIFADWNTLSACLVINTLLIWVWAKINNLYNNNASAKTTLFYIGLIIGTGSFLYFPSIAFFLLIVFALLLTRPFNLAEWIIALVGIITPYYFFVAGLFLTDNLKKYRIQQFTMGYPVFKNYWPLAASLLTVIIFLIGAYFVRANFKKQVVQVRKSWSLLLVYLIVAVLIAFINENHSFEYWILTAVPLSAFIASAFLYPSKKWFPALLYWIMMALVIVICYFIK